MLQLHYYYADWCGPCHSQKPEMKDVEERWNDEEDVSVQHIDLDNNQEQAERNNVRSIPTLLLFYDEEEVERFVGVTSAQELNEAIEQHL